MSDDMFQAVDRMIDKATEDYARFCERASGFSDGAAVEDFSESFEFSKGRKYLKIITNHNGRSVWAFIVLHDSARFRRGDILKPAGWATPATNAPRGNIFDEEYTVRWTGPLYL